MVEWQQIEWLEMDYEEFLLYVWQPQVPDHK